LARAGQLSEAAGHLNYAVEQNPFDVDAARALFQVLGELHEKGVGTEWH
jgi:hypothetical protein